MATTKMELKEFRSALSDDLYQILNSNPNHHKALYKKAKIYYLLDEYDQAEFTIKNLLELCPNNKDVKELNKSIQYKI